MSSENTRRLWVSTTSANDSSSARVYTMPVGLEGLFKIIALVLAVTWALSSSAVSLKPFSSRVRMITGVASANISIGG